jgi:ribonuclease P/MRP protein subunit RPP40
VSLTSVTCKVMESLVREKLIDHLKENNLISDSQHGFVGGRSCATNLIAVFDAWTEILEDGGCIDTIYLDFAKAFDTVPHERLLQKLKGMGIQGKVLQWIRSFLSDRVQKVIVEGEESGWRDVVSGIPQGSVLGPMLFICFINDLPEEVVSEVFVFADDTKLFARVPEKTSELQHDLECLQDWSQKWQLRFNTSKCKVMHLGKQEDPHVYYMTKEATPTALENTSVEKDLGVNVDVDLNFEEHVQTQTSKANKLLGMIRRTFTYLDEVSLPLLYKAIVRPHLEYCNTVWHPKWKKESEALEAVQHRATRLVPSLKEKEYEERLRALSLPSLYYRRARGDMIECFKYVSGVYEVSSAFLEMETNKTTRGHSKKLKKKTATKACRSNFFSRRITNAWNSLPEEVVSAPTLNTFKTRLDKAWKQYQFVQNSDWFKNPGQSSNQ